MQKLDRISINPAKMNGQPCIRDLRITVKRVLELLATYDDQTELFEEFPELEQQDIHQALLFASGVLDDEVINFDQSVA